MAFGVYKKWTNNQRKMYKFTILPVVQITKMYFMSVTIKKIIKAVSRYLPKFLISLKIRWENLIISFLLS